MSIRKSAILFGVALSMAAFMSGCSSDTREGGTPGDVARVDETSCSVCHSSTLDPTSNTLIVQDFFDSSHNMNNVSFASGCQGCHGGGAMHNGVGPIPYPDPFAANICVTCHTGNFAVSASLITAAADDFVGNCAHCHTKSGIGSVHGARVPDTDSCIFCHEVAAPQHKDGLVNDNNGVRAITGEFAKWSHHVTGVTLNDAHCAACHLEGKAVDGKIVIDHTKHMADNKTHLRNSDTDADFAWDPANPNHSVMDNFCMSCHDANGATSAMSVTIQALINITPGLAAPGKTASANNPFGDTISNRYDKMQRPAVVDVFNQFAPDNYSHHAVRAAKYSGKTRNADPRQISNPAAFASNSTATLWGKRSTIYDSVNSITGAVETSNKAFNALYAPLGTVVPPTAATELGDDSTLHCGDCHTVGQWKPGVATNAAGVLNTVAIGAHGSNNEYLLRNDQGSDERHTQEAYTTTAGVTTYTNPNSARLVCYNCHSFTRYGSVYNATGATGPHAGEYDSEGRCNGVGNTIPFNGYTTGTATDGTQFVSRFEGPRDRYSSTPAFAPGFPLNFANAPGGVQAATYTGEKDPDFGNIFGIQCLNCHNSGVENGYGGIHGSKVNTYIDGMGNTQTMRRFLPGLGNTKYVPGTMGGITGGQTATYIGNSRNPVGFQDYQYVTGGVSNATNWEQVQWNFNGTTTAASVGGGCYTLTENPTGATFEQKGLSVDGGATIPNAFGTWGGCDDHGAAQGGGDHGPIKRINRPVTY